MNTIDIDKWIESIPDDCSGYYDSIYEKFSEEFWNLNGDDWVIESNIVDGWIEKCIDKDYQPSKAASLIERAYSLFSL